MAGRLAVAQRHGDRGVAGAATRRIMRRQYPAESLSELRVEYRVDDGIESRVGVAQPGQHFERHARDAGLAEGGDDVDAEERHPAQQERAHDDADRDGGLVVGDVVRRRGVVVDGRVYGRRRGERPGHGAYVLHVFLRVAVEATVDAEHHYTGEVEADTGGDYGVGGLSLIHI